VFRKTVATMLDKAGLSARQIAHHLGHNRRRLTQDVYLGRGLASSEAAAALQRLRSLPATSPITAAHRHGAQGFVARLFVVAPYTGDRLGR
jgi:hypothetical protein